MRASDLPPEIKSAFLGAIKQQMGHVQYQRAVDVIGEDGLLEQVLTEINAQQQSARLPVAGGPLTGHDPGHDAGPRTAAIGAPQGATWLGSVLNLLAWFFSPFSPIGPMVWLLVASLVPGGLVLLTILSVVVLLLFAYARVLDKGIVSTGGEAAVLVGAGFVGLAVVVGVVGGVGYLTLPWVADGMLDWWGWLSSHFR